MLGSSFTSISLSFDKDSNLSLSIASEAFETSSLKNISLLEYKE